MMATKPSSHTASAARMEGCQRSLATGAPAGTSSAGLKDAMICWVLGASHTISSEIQIQLIVPPMIRLLVAPKATPCAESHEPKGVRGWGGGGGGATRSAAKSRSS